MVSHICRRIKNSRSALAGTARSRTDWVHETFPLKKIFNELLHHSSVHPIPYWSPYKSSVYSYNIVLFCLLLVSKLFCFPAYYLSSCLWQHIFPHSYFLHIFGTWKKLYKKVPRQWQETNATKHFSICLSAHSLHLKP